MRQRRTGRRANFEFLKGPHVKQHMYTRTRLLTLRHGTPLLWSWHALLLLSRPRESSPVLCFLTFPVLVIGPFACQRVVIFSTE
jgi:hypothetical protein